MVTAQQVTVTTTTAANTGDPTMESPIPTRAPLLDCKLCELTFDSAQARREHAKSDWHVYKLRCKVAQPGRTVTPPPASPSSKPESRPASPLVASDEDDDDDDDFTEDSPDEEEIEKIEFIPEQCLFCTHSSPDLDANLSHMATAHSLTIPYPSALTVDLQTLIWFLHMVIFSYRECICCGRRKRSVEAVRAHMLSTGHCRFDVGEEMESFYDMDELRKSAPDMGSKPDEQTLRLPSGKLLGHRSNSDQNPLRRQRERSPQTAALPSSSGSQPSTTTTTGSQALTTKKDRRDAALGTALAGLSRGEQMALQHLPASQQRSLLVRHKKALDRAKRAETRKRGRLDRVGDKMAVHTNYYKQEVPVYMGG